MKYLIDVERLERRTATLVVEAESREQAVDFALRNPTRALQTVEVLTQAADVVDYEDALRYDPGRRNPEYLVTPNGHEVLEEDLFQVRPTLGAISVYPPPIEAQLRKLHKAARAS